MSADPYYEVKRLVFYDGDTRSEITLMTCISRHSEVESTLQSLTALHNSYTRLLKQVPPAQHDTSSEIAWSLAELRGTLSAIEGDVEELEETVQAVEERGVAARLGITEQQVRDRRRFVDRVKQEVAVS